MLGLMLMAATIPAGPELTARIAARDAAFFELFFTGCDPAKARSFVTDDIEFYHDKGGVVTRSGDAFIADYAKDCAAKKKPDAWRSRRELVAGTLKVWPVPGFGAIEQGEHVFYERQGDGPEKLVGRALFTQLWQLTPDGWRLSRIFSYDHSPAGK
jgi:hypothetical protein